MTGLSLRLSSVGYQHAMSKCWRGRRAHEKLALIPTLGFHRGRRKAFARRVRARPAQPQSFVCRRQVQLCSGAGEKQLASCSNYNLVFHPSPSLAEAASFTNDIVPCSCVSQFFSGQFSICLPLALAFPRWQGKGEFVIQKIVSPGR